MTMKKVLEIGTVGNFGPFTLPLDFVTRTLAVIGIRGAGKTVAATVIAEEFCEAGLPWIAIDPVSVWWGLRANPDGTPGGYPVVILGGEHGDLPIEKHMGRDIADAILQQNIPCIIDLSGESKTTWRFFVTEFCDRLMELRPAVPRHVFIEEAPELVPQRPMGEQKRSLAAVDRLIRLGRNWGYGATLISQRFATINKDVLTQCESLLALRSIGKPDRKAVCDWIAECVGVSESEKRAEEFLGSLTTLQDGVGWFWSPQWLNRFCQVRIRGRKTYHPGETRKVGQVPKQVALSDVREFVGKFREILGKAVTRNFATTESHLKPTEPDGLKELAVLREENVALKRELSEVRKELVDSKGRLRAVCDLLEPQYKIMRMIFGTLPAAGLNSSTSIDASVYEPWKQKLGAGPAKIIDALIQRGGALTRIQIRTLCGMARRTFQNYLARINANGLIEKDGDLIRLRVP